VTSYTPYWISSHHDGSVTDPCHPLLWRNIIYSAITVRPSLTGDGFHRGLFQFSLLLPCELKQFHWRGIKRVSRRGRHSYSPFFWSRAGLPTARNCFTRVTERQPLIPCHMKRHTERKLRKALFLMKMFHSVGVFVISRGNISCCDYVVLKKIWEDDYE
jgi:hypothetical protein